MRLLTTSPGAPSGRPDFPLSVYANAPASPTLSEISSRAAIRRFSPACMTLENAFSPSTVTDTQQSPFGAISIASPASCGAAAGIEAGVLSAGVSTAGAGLSGGGGEATSERGASPVVAEPVTGTGARVGDAAGVAR